MRWDTKEIDESTLSKNIFTAESHLFLVQCSSKILEAESIAFENACMSLFEDIWEMANICIANNGNVLAAVDVARGAESNVTVIEQIYSDRKTHGVAP